MKTTTILASVAILISLATARGPCTLTLTHWTYNGYSHSTTLTKTEYTNCRGCVLYTQHNPISPLSTQLILGTKTTTHCSCRDTSKAKQLMAAATSAAPTTISSASPSPTTTTFLGTLPGDNVPNDCTFTTLIPFTLSVPTCYGQYVTSTQGIDCQGCGTYTNIAGHGPVRTCGVTAPAATGTTTVLACTA